MNKDNEFIVSEPNNFSVIFNRHQLNKEKKEIDRIARFTKNKNIKYVSFYLSQKYDFNGILYPNEESEKPQKTLNDWINGNKFEKIPAILYQKKLIHEYDNNLVDNYNKNNQENNFSFNNGLRKDSLNSKNRNLEKFINQKEFPNNINSNFKYSGNSQKNNKNNQTGKQTINYEEKYKLLEVDYKTLVSEHQKVKNDLNQYNLENKQYKNLLESKKNENQKLLKILNDYKQNEGRTLNSINLLKNKIK